MIVSVLAAGTRGDAQPPAMLCRALAARGHEVRFIAHAQFADMIAGSDVTINPLPEFDIAAAVKFFGERHNPFVFKRWSVETMKRYIDQIAPLVREYCQGSDIVIGAGAMDYFSNLMVQVLKTKAAHAYMHLAVPPFRLPDVANLPETRHMAKYMHKALGLPPPSWNNNPPIAERNKDQPLLVAYSEAFLPRPAGWPDHVHVTGFWFQDTPPSWRPPADLVRFIESGPPPVYAGFGSMMMNDPQATVNAVLDAVNRNGARAVIAAGWGGLKPANVAENVFAIDSIPHDWLLPKMAASIHHGGAGTLGASLRAGIPQVLVPFGCDQFFWGVQVEKGGLGPRFIPHATLTADALSGAIGKVLHDPSMREKAAAMGERIRAENGLARAVEIIEQMSSA